MTINRQNIALCTIGLLIGACAMLAVLGQRLDTLTRDNTACDHERRELLDQNHLLSMKLEQPNSEPVVESIQVDAQAPDALAQIQVVQFVKEQLNFLIGRSLKALEHTPALPYRILDGRQIEVQQEKLILHIGTVVVTPRLYVMVTASKGD